jgi:hypothetical protein
LIYYEKAEETIMRLCSWVDLRLYNDAIATAGAVGVEVAISLGEGEKIGEESGRGIFPGPIGL